MKRKYSKRSIADKSDNTTKRNKSKGIGKIRDIEKVSGQGQVVQTKLDIPK